MIIAVASGKGGTGKTTVAAGLAVVWKRPVLAVDLDVEEPNLALFLHPEQVVLEAAHLEVPMLDPERCTLCGACAELCQFKAISLMGKHLLLFPELCHGCGGCLRICPSGALQPDLRALGSLETGFTHTGIPCLTGRLRVGEAMSTPLMNKVWQRLKRVADAQGREVIIDAPPGVSCPAMTAVQDASVILLVTEPTPFGLHDLRLACLAFGPLDIPMAVVINKAGLGTSEVSDFCQEQHLPILAEIPFSRVIAEHYAHGGVLPELNPAMRATFESLADQLEDLVWRKAEVAHA